MHVERTQARTAALIVALSLLFVFGLWLPQHLREGRLRERIELARGQRAADGDKAAELSALSKAVIQMQSTMAQSPKTVPPQGELAALLRQLTSASASRGIAGQEVVTQPVIAGHDYSIMPLSLNMRAPFPAVFAYLDRVESLPRIIQINKLEMTGNFAQPLEPLTVRIELSAFFSPPEEAPQ
jgi:Tfp pilus assembly protein PilO